MLGELLQPAATTTSVSTETNLNAQKTPGINTWQMAMKSDYQAVLPLK